VGIFLRISCPSCDWWAILAAAVAALFMTALLRADVPRTEPLALRVMTFNLRFASDTPPNAWPARRPVMKHAIEQAAPDVFGTQEGLYLPLRDMAADLSADRSARFFRDRTAAHV
jgi:hypothetical protein